MATHAEASGSKIWITGGCFSLHYKYTVLLLAICSGLIVLEVTWADGPIVCGSTQPIDERFISSCWRFGLWSKINAGPEMSTAKMVFEKLTPLPGTYHYTFLLLLVQTVFFYVPYFWWSRYDNGSLKNLVAAMTGSGSEDSAADDNDYEEPSPRPPKPARAFLASLNQRGGYFRRYVFFQLVNLLNVIAQISFISYVFQANFVTYGFNFMSNWGGATATNPAFPTFAYCKMPSFGVHDNSTTNYGLCILNVNAINEKVYFAIWFWLMFTAATTALELIGRLIAVCGKQKARVFFQLSYFFRFFKCMNSDLLQYLTAHCDIGDWFILSRIADNVNNETQFRQLLSSLNESVHMIELCGETRMNNKRKRAAGPEHDGASTATMATHTSVSEKDRAKENEYMPAPDAGKQQ